MSSLSEEEEIERVENGECDDKQLAFITMLKDYKVLLSKSQVPSVKEKKAKATTEFLAALQEKLMLTYTKATLSKKISRMKTDVKNKCDANRTGNKKLNLKLWENVMAELIGAETNPSIAQIQGAASVGVSVRVARPLIPSPPLLLDSENTAELIVPPAKRPSLNTVKRKTGDDVLKSLETDDTKLLSLTQLQRLVLLEQLKVLNMKRQRLENEILATKHINVNDGSQFELPDI
ncbi:uncharacterized protein LOC118439255 [Folsomia candida]|uniref:Regulatory protein zeste n=1 Tax=Folsomia candida TaxID=158441 RepID=A0A226D7T2_FOLCA|nr:uncharacterized protein LOC118439255 [Folsomia candida]OXA40691.1 hypothetical protein Fcan01_24527 [Folsomia candida]